MRKFILLCVFLLAGSWARAQDFILGSITAASSDCSTVGSCVTLQLPGGTGSVSVVLRGTFTATAAFQVTGDNTRWEDAEGAPIPSGATVTSATAAGTWVFSVAGMTRLRVRGSAYTSGTITVRITASPAFAFSRRTIFPIVPSFSTMTSGSVLFAGTGGLLSQNNANLFWDNTLGRLNAGPVTGFAAAPQGSVDVDFHTFSWLKSLTNARVITLGAVMEDSTTDNEYAFYSNAYGTHTSGTKVNLYGLGGEAINLEGGDVTNEFGVSGIAYQRGAGTVATMAALRAASNVRSAGTVTNNYGLLVLDQTAGSTNYAIYTGLGSVSLGDALDLRPRPSAPTSPGSGWMYMDSTPDPDELCVYDGTGWQALITGTDANCE